MDLRECINQHFDVLALPRLPDTGLLLLGSNPLPIYAVVLALRPKKILILDTPQVVNFRERIEMLFQEEHIQVLPGRSCKKSDSLDISKKMRLLMEGNMPAWFCYTGGTKAMAVHGYEAWKEQMEEKNCHWAVYLSPSGPRLCFNGVERTFSLAPDQDWNVPQPSLQQICDIHRIEPKPEGICDYHCRDVYCDLAEKIHAYVCNEGIKAYLKLLPPCHLSKAMVEVEIVEICEALMEARGEINLLLDKHLKDGSCFCRFSLERWSKSLGITKHDIKCLDDVIETLFEDSLKDMNSDRRKKKRRDMLQWLESTWIETWVASALKLSNLFHEVHDSFRFKSPGWEKNSEVDVCAMRGHTPFIFSCTIDDGDGLGKHKLFEIRQRANQLGGEHARAAVVCLSGDPQLIKDQLNQGWTGYGTIEVFGKNEISDKETFNEHVKQWILKLESSAEE